MKTLTSFLLILGLYLLVHGQSCRPAGVTYIIRDAKGKTLAEPALKDIVKQMPSPAPAVTSVAFAKDGSLVGYSAKETAKTLPAIYVANAATCRLKVDEWTLKYAGKTMHLKFDLDLDRTAYTIDSIPFQNGTFRLDQKGLSETPTDQIVPAKRWERIGK